MEESEENNQLNNNNNCSDVDYELADSKYQKLCSEFEVNVAMDEYLPEINFIYSAFKCARLSEAQLLQNCGQLQLQMSSDKRNLEMAVEQVANSQRSLLCMKAAVENAFRMVDSAHAREQEAQEDLVTAEKEILLLKSDIEQSTRAALEKEEFGSASTGKDEQKLEKDSLKREVIDLRAKLNQSATIYDELERKNMATGAKMDTMAQHLEVLSTELGKEMRLRESLELQQATFISALSEKESEIKKLQEQLNSVDKLVNKSESLEAEKKAMEDKMHEELETTAAKALKCQLEYEAQLIKVERLSRETSQKSAALKAREDEVRRVKQEAARYVKGQESQFKRLATMEAVRVESERQKDEFRAQVSEREREAERSRKQAEGFKKKLDAANREKELLAKNISKAAGLMEHQVEKAKHMEQMEKTLKTQLQERDEEVTKQKTQVQLLDRERKKMQTKLSRKGEQWEETCGKLKEHQDQSSLAKKQMLKLLYEQKNESALLASLRLEKESSNRQLFTAEAKLERLEEKIQEMETKGVQLKESIISHESFEMRGELVLRKADRERESARLELKEVREQLSYFKKQAVTAENEQKKLQNAMTVLCNQKDNLQEEIIKLEEHRSNLKKKLKVKEDEVGELRQQIKEFEKKSKITNSQYDQRIEEIKKLKLQIQELAKGKELIEIGQTTRDDTRQQVFRLQRDHTEEQLKRKGLEDEVAQTKNVHRWRYLQGEDPERFELIQQLALAHKRLINGPQICKENCLNILLETRLTDVCSAPPTSFNSAETHFQLRKYPKQIKGLMAEKIMLQSQVDDLRQQVHQLGLQLQESKAKFFAQIKKLMKGTVQGKLKRDTISLALQPIHKVRFTGGGFNLNVIPQDSRLVE